MTEIPSPRPTETGKEVFYLDFVHITPGDKLAILSNSKDAMEHPYISYVETVLDKHHIIIYAPIFKTVMLSLPTDTTYEFHFYSKTGLCCSKGKVLESFKQNNVALLKIETEEFEYIQRRNAYRVPIGFQFTFINPNDTANTEDPMSVQSGKVQNISAGGMCFESYVCLQKDDSIVCRLDLSTLCVSISGTILEVQEPANGESSVEPYVYRIQFEEMEHRTKENIINFVFQLQREHFLREKDRIQTFIPPWET